jgi:hypothetical protein
VNPLKRVFLVFEICKRKEIRQKKLSVRARER